MSACLPVCLSVCLSVRLSVCLSMYYMQDLASIERWIASLASEAADRMEKDRQANGRVARSLTVSLTQVLVLAYPSLA